MRISYNKLWDLMKKNKMKKTDLAKAAEGNKAAAARARTMTKMNKNEPVSLEVIMRVCKVFHCDIGEVLEVLED